MPGMKNPPVSRFRGLNNVGDPLSKGLPWLRVADNIDITTEAKMKRRGGYALAITGADTGIYATKDENRLYAVRAGVLCAADGIADGGTVSFGIALKSGLSAEPMRFTEVNDQVFFTNGIDSGIIEPDHTLLDWSWPVPTAVTLRTITGDMPPGQYQVACTFLLADGRETGAGDAAQITLGEGEAIQITGIPQIAGLRTQVYIAAAGSTIPGFAFETTSTTATWNQSANDIGDDLDTANLWPVPEGATLPTFWQGRMWVAQYLPGANQTALWASDQLRFHLFDLVADPIYVPGRVVMLAAHATALVVATEHRINALTAEGAWLKVADYGVAPGHNFDVHDDLSLVIWSNRGMCRFPPFANTTERNVSVAPGSQVGAAIVRKDGEVRFIASLQTGGMPFNAKETS